MATASLFMDIIARDKASSVFNSIGKSAAGMGKGVDRAAKSHSMLARASKAAFGAMSVYSIGRFLSESVKEYAQAELAQNKLENAYQRFPKMARVNIQAFRDLNTAMMQKTRFDDDDAAAMQAGLARYDLTGKQILKLTPLVADLAEAQGTDLVSAGSALGKSFLGNTRALKSLGISYTATGNKAKDMRNIIDLVNKKVGGEATKAGQTTAVKMERLKNTFGELKETVGKAVLPAFSKLVDAAGPAITKLGNWVDEHMPDIEEGFRKAFRAADKVGGAVKGVWDAFSGLPPEAQKIILAMAGGTWAVGKIKGSAFGEGLGSIFKSLKSMSVAAGIVNVKGPVGPGGPGGGGGGIGKGLKTGLTALGAGSLMGGTALASIVTLTVAAVGAASWYAATGRAERDRQKTGGNGTVFAGSYGSSRSMDTPGEVWNDKGTGMSYNAKVRLGATYKSNDAREAARASDAAAAAATRHKKAVIESYKAQDKASASDRHRRSGLNDLTRETDKAGGKTKQFGESLKGLKSKKVKVEEDGSAASKTRVKNLNDRIKELKAKRVKVLEDGASPSSGRVKDLTAKIKDLKDKRVKVQESGAEKSKRDVDNLRISIGKLTDKQITIMTRYETTGNQSGGKAFHATGGYITGPGSATSDSIPAMLSNGEFVIQAAAVKRYGVDFFQTANSMRLSGFKKGTKGKPSELQKEIRQAQKEASRQQRIANQASQRGLSDDVISYLSGLSSQAALKLLKKPTSRLNRLAAQSNAVNTFQTNRQNAADAAAQAATAAAEAQAAAEDAQLERVNSLRDAVDGLAGSYRSFAGIATTSVTDVSDAQSKLADSNQAVIDAQKAVDIAGSDRERALASARLTQALQAQATAQQGVANAGKPTTASIRGNMATKLQKLKDFAGAVKQLKANGLNAVTLAELLQMGPEQGYDFAQALLSGGLADINNLQNEITTTSANLGFFQYGVDASSANMTGYAAAQAAGLVSGGVVMAPAPVTVSIDGNAVAQALISYKRQNGGTIPGLL